MAEALITFLGWLLSEALPGPRPDGRPARFDWLMSLILAVAFLAIAAKLVLPWCTRGF